MATPCVEDEVLFGLENFGVPHEEMPRRVNEALRRAGLEGAADREIATLSGGQKQKVAVAAVMALAPRVLVLDEPTAALDPASSRAVFELLRELNRRNGVTVVVIERKVALLAEFCSRIAVMDAGRVALAGSAREVFGRGRALQALGVDCPRVTRVSNSLRERGLAPEAAACLTVSEACELVEGMLGEAPVADVASVSLCGSGVAGAPAAADVASADPAAVSPDNRSFARASAASGAPCDDATANATPAAIGPFATSAASDAAGASASPAVEFEGGLISPIPGAGRACAGSRLLWLPANAWR